MQNGNRQNQMKVGSAMFISIFGPSQDCHGIFFCPSICSFISHIFPAASPRSELVLTWEAHGKNVGQGFARGGR